MSNWTPNSFVREGEARGYDDQYLAALAQEGIRLRALNLPVVFTLGHLAALCGVPYDYLYEIVQRKSDAYRKFKIKKRAGGYRLITAPEAQLLRVQRWIHQNILSHQSFHKASTAYAAKCDPLSNAKRHAGSRWLVKVDITNFFETISERQVYHAFRRIGYGALLSFQLARICTRIASGSPKYRKHRWTNKKMDRHKFLKTHRIGHLPQGAPTSPLLANLVCVPLDEELQSCATKFLCSYTRYADDIVFSSHQLKRPSAHQIIQESARIFGRYGFTRNKQKTHVASPGSRRVVTGLLVNGDTPRLPRDFREKIEVHLFHAETKGIHEHCLRRKFRSLLGFKAHLRGLITYAEWIDKQFGALCRKRFDALDWGELSEF